jgi:hypothetical protein
MIGYLNYFKVLHEHTYRVNLNIVKNFAKLILFFTLTFIIIFTAVTCLKLLTLRVDWAKSLPPRPETTLTLFISAAHWALSLALFSSILLTLNYVVRRKFLPIISIVLVMVMSFIFSFGISFILNQLKSVPPVQTDGVQLGQKGLILSNAMNRNVTTIILLEGTANPLGPRVTAVPGQPMVFHEFTSANFELPPIPFGDDTPWFMRSISIDIMQNSIIFRQLFEDGFMSYLIYVGSLIFLLCSLGYAIKFSVWPLANLFLAALVFRGVLAFGTLLNSPEIQGVIGSFLGNIIPVMYALPLLFISFGSLVYIYTLLALIIKRRIDDDD